MSWLDFFQTTESTCNIHFGRGIHAQISPQEEELFNNSYEAFEKKEILDAYEYFFTSLINFTQNTPNDNITIKRQEKSLEFTLYQGAAKINGTITKERLYAEATIVKSADASVALKRYILERNYQLTYANYFSDAEFIKIKLYQDNITLSPQKIFFPLRELALNADFDKEHIKSEFTEIALEDISHLNATAQSELEIKYSFLQQWIQELEAKVLTLPSNDNSGMQSFLYLNLLFKIDYLLVPKFKIYQRLSKKVQEYFSNEHSTIEAKNEELRKYLLKLKAMAFEEFCENFYKAKYTFNPIEKSPYDDVVSFINESLSKVRWYKNNRYPQVIPTIYSYIAFHSLYNYGMNSVLKELFHMLVNIQNTAFIEALGCPVFYDTKTETLNKKAITAKLKTISQEAQKKYKSLSIFSEELNFNSLNEFSNSYYAMLKNLDFEEL
jgi:hypothetical protein